MENGSANQSEETPLILATSSTANHSTSQSAQNIKETSLLLTNDENAPKVNSQLQQPEVEGPPTSQDSNQNNEDSVADPVTNEKEKQPKRITLNQKFTFFTIAIASFANFMSFSILAAFFPIEVCACFKGLEIPPEPLAEFQSFVLLASNP